MVVKYFLAQTGEEIKFGDLINIVLSKDIDEDNSYTGSFTIPFLDNEDVINFLVDENIITKSMIKEDTELNALKESIKMLEETSEGTLEICESLEKKIEDLTAEIKHLKAKK